MSAMGKQNDRHFFLQSKKMKYENVFLNNQ